MISSNKQRFVFIIRIWRELRDGEETPDEWRGVIESVHSGEQRYLKNLDEITTFVRPFLEQMGLRSEPSPVDKTLRDRSSEA